MKWISSSGGPLILIPQSVVGSWKGIADGTTETDYVRACNVMDYIGIVECNGHEALVLGDEPLQATLWTEGENSAIVRWMYAPSETEIIECLRSPISAQPVESLSWISSGGIGILFDSALSGNSLPEHLSMPLKAGKYAVRTYVLKPSDEIGLIVHVFEER